MHTFISDISKKRIPLTERVSANTIRKSLLSFIQQQFPDFSKDQYLSVGELNGFREKYISQYISRQIGELTGLEKTVLESLNNNTTLSNNPDEDDRQTLTFGQKIADRVATFGGSWAFIICFLLFIVLWIGINAFWIYRQAFDPYPFILLNLILSCIAALQAPVIMMSQNRQEEKDRERSKKDYMVNLKSEIEIRTLHEKLDHLIMHQQQELLELQRVQIEMMNDILAKVGGNSFS